MYKGWWNLFKQKWRFINLNTAEFAFLQNAQWKRVVPSSLNLKVIYPIGIFCSRQIERYQNHENRTSETYLKLIQFYLITLVKVKCQGHFLGYFVFDLKFFHHMREMVGLQWRSRFNLHIHAQWSVVGLGVLGVLGYGPYGPYILIHRNFILKLNIRAWHCLSPMASFFLRRDRYHSTWHYKVGRVFPIIVIAIQ